MKKVFFKIFLLVMIIILSIASNLTVADVGNFESYDSDSSSSSSDSSWDSSWESSSSNTKKSDSNRKIRVSYGIDYKVYNDIKNYVLTPMMWVVGLALVLVILLPILYYSDKKNKYHRNRKINQLIIKKLKENDVYFDSKEFISDVQEKFIRLQNAWSDRSWEEVRAIESNSLFELHYKQLKEYVDKKQINKIEDIKVNFVDFVGYSYNNVKEVIVVALNSSFKDYIIDEENGKVVKGDPNKLLTNTYKLTFTRNRSNKNHYYKNLIINCPNCGAQIRMASSGRCEYCDSIITTNQHDWILNDMERY